MMLMLHLQVLEVFVVRVREVVLQVSSVSVSLFSSPLLSYVSNCLSFCSWKLPCSYTSTSYCGCCCCWCID
jgi:hypothetical protein